MQNERYYQLIVWRAILPKWHADLERRSHDMILQVAGADHIFEMKNWRGKKGLTGSHGLPGIQAAIDKLQQISNAYLLVFSDNPPELTVENIESLKRSLRGVEWPQIDYRFGTHDTSGKPHEFWIAGWTIPSTSDEP
jgi:hypothetical protein